ncbi:MFS transporter [Roseomonas sp. NAR14]|uniref:MFS transporter n=1 Tax=Roseomonas acroporae TaxID=2937791 RepID=A0A9X1YAG2_9PROT|nr:MFS transporter [Roseomonas acroporae]MCK8786085.1 MFS transporter [Roseomonas acroporae]
MSAETRSLDVGEVIDGEPMSRFQMMTVALCGFVVVLDGFDTQAIGLVAPAIAETFGAPLSSFGMVFSAGLFGLMLGALTLGPIADRVGRRWTVIVATLVFGLFTVLTPSASSLDELALFRFLTGLGLGGAMPNLVALATEYTPKRLQAMIVAWMFAGIPIGAVCGGLVSAALLPTLGWQAVFHVGGILPLVTAVLLIARLPESARFLIVRGAAPERIATLMRRVAPGLRIGASDRFVSRVEAKRGMPVRHLFTEGRALGTILLWVPYFMNLLMIYFVVSWLPAVLRQAHFPLSAGVTAITLFSIGGALGCLATGHLLKTARVRPVVLAEFCAATVLIGTLAFMPPLLWLILAIATLLGFVVQGAQSGLNALVAAYYPTPIRSTGIGWALGIGRIGSIVAPLLGGLMLSLNWSLQGIFLAGTVPAMCAAVAVLAGSARRQDAAAAAAPALQRTV